MVAVERRKRYAEHGAVVVEIVQKRHGVPAARAGDAYFFARIAGKVDVHDQIIAHPTAILLYDNKA